MLIVSDPLVASNYNYPTVKHADIPDFAKHLIAEDSNFKVGSAGSDADSDMEDWYSADLEGQFRRRLHAMRGEIEATMRKK